MKTNYNVKAKVDFTGALINKNCKDKYCCFVDDIGTHFCPSFRGSQLVKDKEYKVRCKKYDT